MALPVEKRNNSEFRVARQQLIAGKEPGSRRWGSGAQRHCANTNQLVWTGLCAAPGRNAADSIPAGVGKAVLRSLRLKAWLLRLLRYLGQRLIRIHKFDVQSEGQVMAGHQAPIKDPVPRDAKVATIDDEL